ncbi:hypothetical protein KY334_06615 [Candidatus Woesearchaeota archaeon]|nr:hypothetical protein [Candidatus Woesearchaeota archaeon]
MDIPQQNPPEMQQEAPKKSKKDVIDPEIISLKEELKRIFVGIKSIEDKMMNLDNRVNVIENNLIATKKTLNTESKALSSRILDNLKEIDLIKKSVTEVVADLKNFARVEEVATIRKYLDLWEPLNFVTREELDDRLSNN